MVVILVLVILNPFITFLVRMGTHPAPGETYALRFAQSKLLHHTVLAVTLRDDADRRTTLAAQLTCVLMP
jgi:hypothetical protein